LPSSKPAELLAFPSGKHDDQVDSVSQFLNWTAKDKFYNASGGLGLPIFPATPAKNATDAGCADLFSGHRMG
jgi:hypothetical protein